MIRTRQILTSLVGVLGLVLAARNWPGEEMERVSPTAAQEAAAANRQNIIFVLTDDMSSNLLKYMPEVQKLQAQGTTFSDYVVSNSLCCPSRSSIYTGQYPHNTGVLANTGPKGGFDAFHDNGQERNTFATALRSKGYRTAMMGKYLNGYNPTARVDGQKPYVPPGWSQWDVIGGGYKGFNYKLAHNHKIEKYGHQPKDYVTDVLSKKGSAFVEKSVAANKPFMLELALFTPHGPSRPAPRDKHAFPGLKAPRSPAYDELPTDAPPWLAGRNRLTQGEKNKIDKKFRKRAQSLQAIDKMIGDLRTTLTRAGVADETYIVFGSDNGFHLGEYRLEAGKQTAFDTDVRVPLVVAGPGVAAGRTSNAQVSNIDLAPTFQKIGGAAVSSRVDGHSLLPLLDGGTDANWRKANLIEHQHAERSSGDPDNDGGESVSPPDYHAMRTDSYTYVEYRSGAKEYYDLESDPYQLHNRADRLSAGRLANLHDALTRLRNCSGDNCWSAGHP
ncbi:sulfatase [Streptomyces sp. BH-SS-21]|uniref:Sulfatase n=1 Tax=Streptomyces liliiviolaceus TaxID=2823109 RepID=A0A940XP26_9ACTN|nr:sulfatase [Streptomyces liliiviolaceus]MBQ0849439.1 sulfatase [Streptomyces liliiviolaceus]